LTSKRKTEVVLQLLCGENIKTLSRQNKVTVADLSQWRDKFAQLYEGFYNIDANQYGCGATQHSRKHGNTFFIECMGVLDECLSDTNRSQFVSSSSLS